MSIDTPEFVALTEKIKNNPFNHTILEDIFAFLNHAFCEVDKAGFTFNNIPLKFPSTYTLAAILQQKRDEVSNWINSDVATLTYNGKLIKNYTFLLIEFHKSYNTYNSCIAYFISFIPFFIHHSIQYSTHHNYNTCLNIETRFWANIMFAIITQASYSGEIVANSNYVFNTIINLLKYKNTFADIIQFYKKHRIPHFLGLEPSTKSGFYENMITSNMDNEITEVFQAYPDTLDKLFENSKQLNYLQMACKYNCPKFVDYLLSSANALTMVQHKSNIQYNAIHYAALQSEDMLSKFLHFPEHLFSEVPTDNKTALWHACNKNYKNILPAIIEKTSPEHHGRIAAEHTPLMRCCANRNLSAATQLLDAGNSMVEYCSERSGNAIFYATYFTEFDSLCVRMINIVISKEKDIKYYLNGVQNILMNSTQLLRTYFSYVHHVNNNTVLINACENKLRETVNVLLQERLLINGIYKINKNGMDALCCCLLNNWDNEVMELIKFNKPITTNIKQAFSSYVSDVKTINSIQRNPKIYYTMLIACIRSYLAHTQQEQNKKPILQILNILIGRMHNPYNYETPEYIDLNVPVFSALDAAENSLEQTLQTHDIILLHQGKLYATTIEFLFKSVTDLNQIKFGCNRVIEDINTFDSAADVGKDAYISLTLFGIPSGVIAVEIILHMLISGKRYFKLTEIPNKPPYPGMISKAWIMGMQSASADHCQPDPQGRPFFQQPYMVEPIKNSASENNKRTMVEEETPVEKRATPSLSIMISGTTYPLTVGLQNTLQELYDEIMTYKPDAASFRIVFSGVVIRSADLQTNGSMQISEYEANNRKIFSGDNLKIQVMFMQPTPAPVGGGRSKKRRQSRRQRRNRRKTVKR